MLYWFRFLLFLFFLSNIHLSAQSDSIFYYKKVKENSYTLFQTNLDSILVKNVHKILDSIVYSGYYKLQLDSVRKNKVYTTFGPYYNQIIIEKANYKTDFPQQQKITLEEYQYGVLKELNTLENNGYPLARIKIDSIRFKEEVPIIHLKLDSLDKRTVQDWVLQGYPKFPKRLLSKISDLKTGKTYQKDKLIHLNQQIDKHPFLETTKPPATLFTKDSTLVYFYLKKQRATTFDGLLGFGNNADGTFKFTGNINLDLQNTFNRLEQILFHWKSSLNGASNLELTTRFPYIRQSNFGLHTHLNIFRQDSTYINTDLALGVQYQLNHKSRVGLNYLYLSSNYLKEDTSNLWTDFSSNGYQLNLNYKDYPINTILEYTNVLDFNIAHNTRKSEELSNSNQIKLEVDVAKNIQFISKHFLESRIQWGYIHLNNSELLNNEQFRIGGIRSIRGFDENQIFASHYAIGSLNYKYVPRNDFYLTIFVDYASLKNNDIPESIRLIGLGTGLGIRTSFGILNLMYAVGKNNKAPFDTKNGKIHIGLKSIF